MFIKINPKGQNDSVAEAQCLPTRISQEQLWPFVVLLAPWCWLANIDFVVVFAINTREEHRKKIFSEERGHDNRKSSQIRRSYVKFLHALFILEKVKVSGGHGDQSSKQETWGQSWQEHIYRAVKSFLSSFFLLLFYILESKTELTIPVNSLLSYQ